MEGSSCKSSPLERAVSVHTGCLLGETARVSGSEPRATCPDLATTCILLFPRLAVVVLKNPRLEPDTLSPKPLNRSPETYALHSKPSALSL